MTQEEDSSLPPQQKPKENKYGRWGKVFSHPTVIAAIITSIGAVLAALILVIFIPPCPTCPTLTATPLLVARYSFEDSSEGWECQSDAPDTAACVKVERSTKYAKDGEASLEITMNLNEEFGHDKGEAFVELGEPLDLTNQTITIWVHGEEGSLGDPRHLNGFQVFVKDMEWDSEYGCWHNAILEETGREVTLTVTVEGQTCNGFYQDRDFDPTHIRAVGIKMGLGEGSNVPYSNKPIYIDAVSWSDK